MNRPEHLARFEEAFRSEDPTEALYRLAVGLRDEGVSQVALYRLYIHFHRVTREDDPRCDAILDTLDVIWGGPLAKGHSLYSSELTDAAIEEAEKE